eukprot:4919882-Pleurochrysis_carterae.AAC.2
MPCQQSRCACLPCAINNNNARQSRQLHSAEPEKRVHLCPCVRVCVRVAGAGARGGGGGRARRHGATRCRVAAGHSPPTRAAAAASAGSDASAAAPVTPRVLRFTLPITPLESNLLAHPKIKFGKPFSTHRLWLKLEVTKSRQQVGAA